MINSSHTNESDIHNNGGASSPSMHGGTRDTPKGEFRNFLSDIEDLIKATTSMSGDDLARAKAALNARIVKAKQSVEKMGDDIAAQARHTAEVTNSYVHERPWQSMGIVAAVGILIGVALARRK